MTAPRERDEPLIMDEHVLAQKVQIADSTQPVSEDDKHDREDCQDCD